MIMIISIFLPGYHKHTMWIWHQTQRAHCKYVNLLLEYCYVTVTVKARFWKLWYEAGQVSLEVLISIPVFRI